MRALRPACLSIAGFDPSGGAGIIADCKTFEQLKVTSLGVITANTFQTEDEFSGLEWIPENTILRQLDLLLSRYSIDTVKIGLIENGSVLNAVIDCILQHKPKAKIIWDPVINASADTSSSLQKDRFQNELNAILDRIFLVTPNVPEYTLLFSDAKPEEVSKAIKSGILLKGGHSDKPGRDALYTGGEITPLNPKITGDLQKHGSGCILSAAITAHIARKFPLKKSIFLSKRYTEAFLTSQPGLLGYHSR